MTLIPSRLRASYRSTAYIIFFDGGARVLRAGRPSAAADSLLRDLDKKCGVFITAWNPGSRPCGRRANAAAMRRLEADLLRPGATVLRAVGKGRGWPAEPSYFAAGLSRGAGCRLGRRYRQNAVLHVARRKPVELVLLR